MSDLKELFAMHSSVVIDDGEVEVLSEISVLEQYEEGKVLFEADDPGDSVFMVRSGAVDLYTIVNSDIEQTLLSVREGGFVGIMALIHDGARDINARVSEKAELYKFDTLLNWKPMKRL